MPRQDLGLIILQQVDYVHFDGDASALKISTCSHKYIGGRISCSDLAAGDDLKHLSPWDAMWEGRFIEQRNEDEVTSLGRDTCKLRVLPQLKNTEDQ